VMPCEFSVWAPFWTDYVAHIASISCGNVFLSRRGLLEFTRALKLPLEVERFSLFAVFHNVIEVLLIYSNFH